MTVTQFTHKTSQFKSRSCNSLADTGPNMVHLSFSENSISTLSAILAHNYRFHPSGTIPLGAFVTIVIALAVGRTTRSNFFKNGITTLVYWSLTTN